jgi:pyridinium-3,5-biscarboxylic acid mononucleotide synthase
MNIQRLKDILTSVSEKKLSVSEGADILKNLAFENIDYATIDHHRSIRKGFPEVIYGESKTSEQIIGIMNIMIKQENIILVTRINKKKAEKIIEKFPDASFYEDAKIIELKNKDYKNTIKNELKNKGLILVISAGTSDIPVAKEALITAKAMGNNADYIFDIGVAGIHRLFEHKDIILKASVIIVVAGMEGALPSVVAGMVKSPVIAVPTSVGYGTSFGGLTALFGMLNSCSSNVAVVNIDNGFGAGYLASCIINL